MIDLFDLAAAKLEKDLMLKQNRAPDAWNTSEDQTQELTLVFWVWFADCFQKAATTFQKKRLKLFWMI